LTLPGRNRPGTWVAKFPPFLTAQTKRFQPCRVNHRVAKVAGRVRSSGKTSCQSAIFAVRIIGIAVAQRGGPTGDGEINATGRRRQ